MSLEALSYYHLPFWNLGQRQELAEIVPSFAPRITGGVREDVYDADSGQIRPETNGCLAGFIRDKATEWGISHEQGLGMLDQLWAEIGVPRELYESGVQVDVTTGAIGGFPRHPDSREKLLTMLRLRPDNFYTTGITGSEYADHPRRLFDAIVDTVKPHTHDQSVADAHILDLPLQEGKRLFRRQRLVGYDGLVLPQEREEAIRSEDADPTVRDGFIALSQIQLDFEEMEGEARKDREAQWTDGAIAAQIRQWAAPDHQDYYRMIRNEWSPLARTNILFHIEQDTRRYIDRILVPLGALGGNVYVYGDTGTVLLNACVGEGVVVRFNPTQAAAEGGATIIDRTIGTWAPKKGRTYTVFAPSAALNTLDASFFHSNVKTWSHQAADARRKGAHIQVFTDANLRQSTAVDEHVVPRAKQIIRAVRPDTIYSTSIHDPRIDITGWVPRSPHYYAVAKTDEPDLALVPEGEPVNDKNRAVIIHTPPLSMTLAVFRRGETSALRGGRTLPPRII